MNVVVLNAALSKIAIRYSHDGYIPQRLCSIEKKAARKMLERQ